MTAATRLVPTTHGVPDLGDYTALPESAPGALAARLFALGLTCDQLSHRIGVSRLVLLRILDEDLVVTWRERERILVFLADGGRR